MIKLFILLISFIHFPTSVDQYQLFETTFQLGKYDNPYDPEVIDVYADFTGPNGQTRRVVGFYYEGYNFMKEKGYEVASRNGNTDGWRVRFTPDLPGRWTCVIHAKDRKGEQHSDIITFNCKAKDHAEGFISVANTKYLKRAVVTNGRQGYRSFFPVGPNVAWYSSADYNNFRKPYGIYDYERYIDALSGNANYMRIWVNRYQYLALYGPEHAIRESNGKPKVYFDTSINQKDAAELDHIVDYAAQHGINLMVCLFVVDDFRDDSEALGKSEKYGTMPSGWRYNPYHTILGLKQPVEFFTNAKARRVTRNLLRYCVARWGYATNIAFWELFNEVDHIFRDETMTQDTKDALVEWHAEMARTISSLDPHHHIVTTSMAVATGHEDLEQGLVRNLDFVQRHSYHNIQKSSFKDQMSQKLYEVGEKMHAAHPTKPVFVGEYGFGSNVYKILVDDKDPYGIELHNTLWSSLFAGTAGPASFWWWLYLEKKQLFGRFRPVTTFCQKLPLLSDTFVGKTTGVVEGMDLLFPNQLETYYLENAAQDTLLGWAQDVAFAYQSLRRLTDREGNNKHFLNDGVFDPEGYVYTLDPAKRPEPSSSNNRIVLPIENQPRGTRYEVRWFDSETGEELVDEATTVTVRRPWFSNQRITIEFPSSVRDLRRRQVNNTFGDAVFMITKIP